MMGFTWVGGQLFCMSMDTHWLEIRCFVCEGLHMG